METKKDKTNIGIKLLVRKISERIPNRIEEINKTLNKKYLPNLEWCAGRNINPTHPDKNSALLEYLKEKYPGLISCFFLEKNKRNERVEYAEDFIDKKINALPLDEMEEVYKVLNSTLEEICGSRLGHYKCCPPKSRLLDEKVTALCSV